MTLVLPDEIFNLYTLECANKANKEVCGEDCSVTVPSIVVAEMGGPHVLAISCNWQVLSHACMDPEHPVHHQFFCSTVCLADWSAIAKAEVLADQAADSEAEKRRGN